MKPKFEITPRPLREKLLSAGIAASMLLLASCAPDKQGLTKADKIEMQEALIADEYFHTDTTRLLKYLADNSGEATISEDGLSYTITPNNQEVTSLPSISYRYDPTSAKVWFEALRTTIGADSTVITSGFSAEFLVNQAQGKSLTPKEVYARFESGGFWPYEVSIINQVGTNISEISAIFGVDGGPVSVLLRDENGQTVDVTTFTSLSNRVTDNILSS